MSRNEMGSGSKRISIASGGPGWVPYVGLSFAPPVYPTRVEMTPSRWRSSSWTPQKQPPARMAVSVLALIVSPSLRGSVSVVVLPVKTGIALSECERVGVGAWLEEGDLQRPLA